MLPSNAFTRRIIEQAQMPAEHRPIWDYFLNNQMRYPRATFIPPFKRPKRGDKPRNIAVGEFEAVESDILGSPKPIYLRVVARNWRMEIPLCGVSDESDTIRRALFSFRTRGWLTVFRFGNARDLRIFVARYTIGLTRLGFTVQPINAGSELIAIKVRKNGHTWTLVDFERSAGIAAEKIASMCPSINGVKCACFKCLEAALGALYTIQSFLVANFRTCLKVSIGSAAIRAAALTLPRALWKWKPHPLLVTMCRLGGAYRGGIIVGRGYRGPAWLLDSNRLYTWAIARELPQSASLASGTIDGVLRPGIYVCTIVGPATFPIYVPVWRDDSSGFSIEYWNGDSCCTVLPTSEIEGLRALGYTVTVGFGFQFFRTFNLAAYAQKLLGVVKKYGTNHTFSRITKLMGNAVYGKFGERPERVDCIFSTTRPSPDCFPFLDSIGNEIENLWERKHTRYNSHQHVDIAATITGYGRNHMYHSISAILAKGGIIAATNTDSIITNVDPSDIFELNDTTPGMWRQVVYDPDGITVARNAWAVGEHIALAGAPKHDRNTIELLARGQSVILHGIQKARLLPGGPISQPYAFSYGATNSTDNLDSIPKSSAQLPPEMAVSFVGPPLAPLQRSVSGQET